jgi:hypothetical protein
MRWLLLVLVLLAVVGCDAPVMVRPLPAPPPETPPVNLPLPLRQSNWTASNGEGSCVHASLTSHLRWQNQLQLADVWRKSHSGGEYASRLRQRLDNAKIPYTYTESANPSFLDWCHETRRGAILWWKPSHCCTFLGWVVKDGRQHAAILDNNSVRQIELTERSQFLRLWAGYGGFALAVTGDPATQIPWQSYEVLDY